MAAKTTSDAPIARHDTSSSALSEKFALTKVEVSPLDLPNHHLILLEAFDRARAYSIRTAAESCRVT
jgi:hypothetical protein